MLYVLLTKEGRLFGKHKIGPDGRHKEVYMKPFNMAQNDDCFAHIFPILG